MLNDLPDHAFVQDGNGRVARGRSDPLHGPTDACLEIGTQLATRILEAHGARLPVLEESRILSLDFLAGEPFPAAEVDFPQVRLDPNLRTAAHDRCCSPGPLQRARDVEIRGFVSEFPSHAAHLGSALRREPYIGAAVVADARFAVGLAVANKDQAADGHAVSSWGTMREDRCRPRWRQLRRRPGSCGGCW
ncbi:MAG: hypothetical protein JRG95_14965 [Deltaproteobacteria bacterium]|nr:hypothetical protein [Deltaproteobacteria bacterium]